MADQEYPSLQSPTARELMRDGMTLPDGTVVYPSQNALERIESEVADIEREDAYAGGAILIDALDVMRIAREVDRAAADLALVAAKTLKPGVMLRAPDVGDVREVRKHLREATADLQDLVRRMDEFDIPADDPVRRALERLGDDDT